MNDSTPSIKVIIAVDHKLFRQTLIDSIDSKYGITFIDEIENGEQLIKSYCKFLPDIVLVDILMPVLSALEAIREMKKLRLEVKSLFLSMLDYEEYFYDVLEAGGKGLVGKNCSKGQLVDAIRTVNEGMFYYNKPLSEFEVNFFFKKMTHFKKETEKKTIRSLKKDKLELLTTREKEVFTLFGKGLTREKISEILYVSINTIDFHKRNIMHKLEAISHSQFMKFAFEYVYFYSKEEIFPKM